MMILNEIYKRLELADDCLIRLSDPNWKNKVSFPSRIYRLLETNDLLKDMDAFFYFDNKPLILFFNGTKDKQALHRAIWNFNESPIVIIVENNAVEIYNGFSFNKTNKLLNHIGGNDDLDNFKYFQLVTGKTWEIYQTEISHRNRVDYKLLENINAAQDLLKGLKLSQSLANALIGKIIFYRYLIDRKVRLNYNGKELWTNEDLCDCLADKNNFISFVSYLEDDTTGFNGDVFRIRTEDYKKINQDALNVLIRLLQSEDLKSGQQSLFDIYDFSILPIEFISNVYEKFIGIEKQDEESAYYTPTFLVDYIIAETVEKRLKLDDKNYSCRILDPSCGSGIFLVESLRRIIEKYIVVENVQNTNTESFRESLRNLVCDNIFGIDKDYDAIQVAIFSIYLTLLDYQKPADIEKFKFPDLYGTNLIHSDAFDLENENLKELEERKLHFDYVIGNPPWKRGGIRKGSLCEQYLKKKQLFNNIGNRELAQAFVLRSIDFTDTNTHCALVVASKILYNIDSQKFRKFILDTLCLTQVFELASVRREVFNKSNDKAIAPACVLFYKNALGKSTDKNIITHIALKKSRFFSLFHIFSLTRNDIQKIQQNRLKQDDWLWKVLVYGSYLDYIFIKRVKELPKLSDIISAYGFIRKQGIKEKDQNKCIDVSSLVGMNYIKTKNVKEYHVLLDNDKWTIPVVGYIYKKSNAIVTDLYKAPILFITGGTKKDLHAVAAICYNDGVFKSSITGIKGFGEDAIPVLRNMQALLNSNFFSYYNLLTFSSSGIEREETHDDEKLNIPYCDGLSDLVENMEKLMRKHYASTLIEDTLQTKIREQNNAIENLIYDRLNCADYEIDLVDYARTISIPLATKCQGYEKVFTTIGKEDTMLYDYAHIYINHFSNSFNRNGKRFMVEIHYSSQMIGMFFKVINDCDYRDDILFIQNTNNELMRSLHNISTQKITNRLFVLKDIRGFEKNCFYIFKPNERRLWHKAIAHLDVNEFDDAILKAGRNE